MERNKVQLCKRNWMIFVVVVWKYVSKSLEQNKKT